MGFSFKSENAFKEYLNFANKNLERVSFLCTGFTLLISILNFIGFFSYPVSLMTIALCFSVLNSITIFILRRTKIRPDLIKYIVAILTQAAIFTLTINPKLQITIIFFLVPLVSISFFSIRFTAFTSIMATSSMIFTTVYCLQEVHTGLEHILSLNQFMTSAIIGKIIGSIIMSTIICTFTGTCRYLIDRLNQRNKDINTIQNNLVYSFADMIESRDGTTGEHVKRSSQTVSALVDYLKSNDIYKGKYPEDYFDLIKMASPLHDIGKIKVPDAILSKPGKLTNEEYSIIKTHSLEGGKIIKGTMTKIEDSQFVKVAEEMAVFHHEKWNGKGYPFGISYDKIPLSARIMAVADVFDALCSKRSYKEEYSIDEAFQILEDSKGTHFEPVLVDAMEAIRSDLEKIYFSKKVELDPVKKHE